MISQINPFYARSVCSAPRVENLSGKRRSFVGEMAIDLRGVSAEWPCFCPHMSTRSTRRRSEEHTSELQSRENLVCRLRLGKKKNWKRCLRMQTRSSDR